MNLYKVKRKRKIQVDLDELGKFDYIIPVPSKSKPSMNIALHVSELSGKPIVDCVQKLSNKKMKAVPINIRKVVARDLFQIVGKIKANKTYLLVDDITTTGATMNTIAEKLIEKRAKKIIGLVLIINK